MPLPLPLPVAILLLPALLPVRLRIRCLPCQLRPSYPLRPLPSNFSAFLRQSTLPGLQHAENEQPRSAVCFCLCFGWGLLVVGRLLLLGLRRPCAREFVPPSLQEEDG